MMGFNTSLLIIVAFYTCYIYLSSTKQIENLQQNIKTLQEILAQLKKTSEEKGTCSIDCHNMELRAELSQLTEKISSLQAEVDLLENLLKAHKDEDQEDKLCLIEGMKRIGKFLGQDGVSVEAGDEAWNAGLGGHTVREGGRVLNPEQSALYL
jgi:uncharacterized protein YlxW (UPF0749 family)